MKILHTADWHIGSFKGPEKDGVNLRGEDTMNCLRELVRVAQEKKPELTLVSGDIFHQAEIWQGRSHREVLQAREIIMKLAEVSENVVVMRGTPNHDSAEAFAELQAHFELVPNVEVVTEPKVVNTPYAQIAVLPGFDRGTFRAKFPGLSKEQENEVFSNEIGNIVAGLRAMCQDESRIAVLMSHYTVPGCNMESGQTQFLMQFEPVITREMLLAADYDLVALGHIHRPQKLEGMKNVFYSGAVNAMNFNDEGQDRGFMLHEFRPDYEKMKLFYEGTQFRKTPSREFLTIRWNKEDVAQAISNPDMLPMTFTDQGVADKIVRIIYSCTSDQKKAINTAQIEKALYEAGAFWKADIVMDKLEDVNRTELSKFDDPETNLIQYLTEKDIEPGQINRIVERARPIIARALASSSTADSSGSFVPKQIEVKNYRNYVEESFSFDDISFCTINGQNGAGKSSLFMDAILDCLYEEPREGSNTGWIRNDEKARSGSISFTFGLGEKTYRVVRTRAKSGKGTLNLSELIEGEWIDRSKEKYKDTQDEIIKVLGMDSLTFKACVLIMQDQYGLFLEAGKDIRIDVLSNLIGLEIYNSIKDTPSIDMTCPLQPYIEVEFFHKGESVKRKKKFRKFRQTVGGKTVYFKEFGDPRIMNKKDGTYWNQGEEPIKPDDIANEILDFPLGDAPYGEVRWIGQVLTIDGNRRAEILNNNYFRKGRHTPLMILIKGGTLSDESYEKLQRYVNDIEGESGQHSFLVLETDTLESGTAMDEDKQPNVEVKDLASILQKDELFQEYQENGRKKTQSAFLLPDLYVGYTKDFNRSTSQACIEVTEKQVFQPERESLGWIINKRLLNGYRFRHVEAYLMEPDVTDPDDVQKILNVTERAGGLTPNVAKELTYKTLGLDNEEPYAGKWGDIPLAYQKALTQAQQNSLLQQPSVNTKTDEEPAVGQNTKPQTKTKAVTDDEMSQLDDQIQKAESIGENTEVIEVLKSIRKALGDYEVDGGADV